MGLEGGAEMAADAMDPAVQTESLPRPSALARCKHTQVLSGAGRRDYFPTARPEAICRTGARTSAGPSSPVPRRGLCLGLRDGSRVPARGEPQQFRPTRVRLGGRGREGEKGAHLYGLRKPLHVPLPGYSRSLYWAFREKKTRNYNNILRLNSSSGQVREHVLKHASILLEGRQGFW